MNAKTKKTILLILKAVVVVSLAFFICGCYTDGYDPDKDPFYMRDNAPTEQLADEGQEIYSSTNSC